MVFHLRGLINWKVNTLFINPHFLIVAIFTLVISVLSIDHTHKVKAETNPIEFANLIEKGETFYDSHNFTGEKA